MSTSAGILFPPNRIWATSPESPIEQRLFFIPKGRMIWPKPIPEEILPNQYLRTARQVIYDERDVLDVKGLDDVNPPCIKGTESWYEFYRAFRVPSNTWKVKYFITDMSSVQTLKRHEWFGQELEAIQKGNYIPCFKPGCGRAVHLGAMYCDRHEHNPKRIDIDNYFNE